MKGAWLGFSDAFLKFFGLRPYHAGPRTVDPYNIYAYADEDEDKGAMEEGARDPELATVLVARATGSTRLAGECGPPSRSTSHCPFTPKRRARPKWKGSCCSRPSSGKMGRWTALKSFADWVMAWMSPPSTRLRQNGGSSPVRSMASRWMSRQPSKYRSASISKSHDSPRRHGEHCDGTELSFGFRRALSLLVGELFAFSLRKFFVILRVFVVPLCRAVCAR